MPSAASSTLSVMADHLDRYHEQVAAMVPGFQGDDEGDVVRALVEAERGLRTAARLVRRAGKLSDRPTN